MMNLKKKIFETFVLGGVGVVGASVGQRLIIGLLGAPPGESVSLGGTTRVSVDPAQLERGTTAFARGLAAIFGIPTAAPAPVFSPPTAPAPEPEAAPRQSCCSACKVGRPCCAGVNVAGSDAHDEHDDEHDHDDEHRGEQEDLGFLGFLGATPAAAIKAATKSALSIASEGQRKHTDRMLEEMSKQYQAAINAAKGSGETTARLEMALKEIQKAQKESNRLRLPAQMPQSKSEFERLFELFMSRQAPAPAPAPAPPIILTPPWGAPAAAAPQVAPPPVAPAPVQQPDPFAEVPADLWGAEAYEDPFAGLEEIAAMSMSGLGGSPKPAAKRKQRGRGASSIDDLYPSCGC